MAVDRTELISELQQLRRGYGLTPHAIANCPNLLETLGNLPPEQAVERLTELVRNLGDHEPALVLRIAYAIDVDTTEVLTARRQRYCDKSGRNIKTVIGYEDKAIEELATQLASDERTGLLICAFVKERRIYQAAIEYFDRAAPAPKDIERKYGSRDDSTSLPVWRVIQLAV